MIRAVHAAPAGEFKKSDAGQTLATGEREDSSSGREAARERRYYSSRSIENCSTKGNEECLVVASINALAHKPPYGHRRERHRESSCGSIDPALSARSVYRSVPMVYLVRHSASPPDDRT